MITRLCSWIACTFFGLHDEELVFEYGDDVTTMRTRCTACNWKSSPGLTTPRAKR